MSDTTVIHIEWEGPFSRKEIEDMRKEEDLGIYQLYGGHPTYGGCALLYIGLVEDQTFATRIEQHAQRLQINRDARATEVYVGRLFREGIKSVAEWKQRIRLAERLLIYSHSPCLNAQKELMTLDQDLKSVHILNWGCHRDLMPEVSGARWSSLHNKLKFVACSESLFTKSC